MLATIINYTVKCMYLYFAHDSPNIEYFILGFKLWT